MVLSKAPVRALALGLLAVGIELLRVVGMSDGGHGGGLLAGVLGGAGLCLLAAGWSRDELGLAGGRVPARLLGMAALTVVLLLPAAVRWTGQAPLGGGVALAAVVISVGEEVAFRGALFAAVRRAAGPAPAVVVSALAWTAAHALSHPVAFLPAVLGAGLLLGLWRWYADDLAAPIGAHVLADLAL